MFEKPFILFAIIQIGFLSPRTDVNDYDTLELCNEMLKIEIRRHEIKYGKDITYKGICLNQDEFKAVINR